MGALEHDAASECDATSEGENTMESETDMQELLCGDETIVEETTDASSELKMQSTETESASGNDVGDVSQGGSGETAIKEALFEELNDELYGEIGDLAKQMNDMVGKMRDTESEIESVSNDIPLGTDELSEVSRKTEEATQKILDDTDRVMDNNDAMERHLNHLKATLYDETLQSGSEIKDDITALCELVTNNKKEVFDIVGALSFQDPAGQQIRRVSNMLEALQSRILKLVVNFGQSARGTEVAEARQEEFLTELEYSSDGEALGQDLVDAVLKEYGF